MFNGIKIYNIVCVETKVPKGYKTINYTKHGHSIQHYSGHGHAGWLARPPPRLWLASHAQEIFLSLILLQDVILIHSSPSSFFPLQLRYLQVPDLLEWVCHPQNFSKAAPNHLELDQAPLHWQGKSWVKGEYQEHCCRHLKNTCIRESPLQDVE